MKARGKRILIVDDEPPIQRMLRRNLSVSGYDVLVADTGENAIEMVHLHKPDLILLDLSLPGELDGLDVCRQVRHWTQTPIIVVSSRPEDSPKLKALDLRSDGFFTK